METNSNSGSVHNVQPALAKTMIDSFRATISDDTTVRALTFNAQEVRQYLSDDSIDNFVVFFAHTADWAQNHYGEASTAEMTVVLVGTDASGIAVKNSAEAFLDYANPCPTACSSIDAPGFWG